MTAHTLKTWPTFFQAVWDGRKTYEVRLDDRGYQAGDTVMLAEWDRKVPCSCIGSDHVDDCAKFTGREVTARIGFVTASTPPRGSQRGFVGNGYVVFSLVDPQKVDGRKVAPAEAMRRVAGEGASS